MKINRKYLFVFSYIMIILIIITIRLTNVGFIGPVGNPPGEGKPGTDNNPPIFKEGQLKTQEDVADSLRQAMKEQLKTQEDAADSLRRAMEEQLKTQEDIDDSLRRVMEEQLKTQEDVADSLRRVMEEQNKILKEKETTIKEFSVKVKDFFVKAIGFDGNPKSLELYLSKFVKEQEISQWALVEINISEYYSTRANSVERLWKYRDTTVISVVPVTIKYGVDFMGKEEIKFNVRKRKISDFSLYGATLSACYLDIIFPKLEIISLEIMSEKEKHWVECDFGRIKSRSGEYLLNQIKMERRNEIKKKYLSDIEVNKIRETARKTLKDKMMLLFEVLNSDKRPYINVYFADEFNENNLLNGSKEEKR